MNEYIDGDKIVHSTLESGEDLFIKDQWKREYHFKIESFPVPTGLASEAIEVKEDNMSGYIFNILSDFDEDPEIAKERLMAVRTEIPCFACHLRLSGERSKVIISALRDL